MAVKKEDFFENCTLCPRKCMTNRYHGQSGYCRSDAGFNVASVCIHRGEEPAISGKNGICNVFFGHCNMQCIFCQNHQISNNKSPSNSYFQNEDDILDEIFRLLELSPDALGFVSPSHQVAQMIRLIEKVKQHGRNPVIVYNSNGYDSVSTLRELEEVVDVYLPDFKYSDNRLANELSATPLYFETASAAIREMYRQKGSTLLLNENGYAERGLIIRHLVLPGNTENSIGVLKYIAEELSPNVNVSLMAQYYPVSGAVGHSVIGRKLFPSEYFEILTEMQALGLNRGWVQDLGSPNEYRPDFYKKHPFEY